MSWKLSLAQRIRLGASLAVVFLLILATNLIDKNHFRIVKENLTTVYEDRLLTKTYLYEISRLVQQKKEIYKHDTGSGMNALNQQINDSITLLIKKFASTKLTENESVHFKSLQRNWESLKKLETREIQTESIRPEAPFSLNTEDHFQAIYENLDTLFRIQLKEGSRVIHNSTQTIGTSNFISKLEIAALIAIGVLIQLLIFLRPIKK
ncbi:MCP four helix bundle domain-containing protein [Ekhidna sp.]|uniref:MCP four helix bundle domain-containing protein n=1 Tax=Ekhidna sp. TaxID=2608089 RepID=UPI003C7D76BA